MKSISLFRTHISAEAVAAAVETLNSGWLGQGAKVKAFESAFAAYVGASECIAVNRGTSALHLALEVLGLPEGAEVITTPLTYVATHHAILYAGCSPVMADIQPSTGNLDPAAVREKVSERTRAILLVHYAGYPCDLDAFYALAAELGLAVIEDCAHATGATYHGARIGSFDSLQCFSFDPIKNLTMGDGGAITMSNRDYSERLRRLRNLGIDHDAFERRASGIDGSNRWSYKVRELGYRYHLSDLNAAIGLAQLEHLDAENQRRTEIAGAYRTGLCDVPGLRLLDYQEDRHSSYFMYPVLVDRRQDLMAKLASRGIETGVHYPPNDLLGLGSNCDLPHAVEFWERVVTLPLHPQLSADDVGAVINCIRDGW